jgi:hypothetical protein
MEERIFRELKKSEIRVIKPTLIELKAEEGWLITDVDKSLKTETGVVYLPSEKYISDYCCISKLENIL